MRIQNLHVPRKFQSTLPLRGATCCGSLQIHVHVISIHTPLAGSDHLLCRGIRSEREFQSTLPLRGATGSRSRRDHYEAISIHTPLAGSDPAS